MRITHHFPVKFLHCDWSLSLTTSEKLNDEFKQHIHINFLLLDKMGYANQHQLAYKQLS